MPLCDTLARFMARHLSILVLCCLFCGVVSAEPQWIRYPAISPSGEWIAFSCRGDLWVTRLDSGGAIVEPLTTHVGHETMPVWSPDSKHVAFASDRHGNFDVFVIDVAQRRTRRLTYHSTSDMPSAFSPDGTHVWFSSRRLDAPQAAVGSPFLTELYAVPTEGGRPVQLLTTPAERARPDKNGERVVYQDLKGYENPWRKHHTSSVARDIWIWERATGKHRKLSDFVGEDRDPVWSADGKTVYYLSEQSGSLNVWSRPVQGGTATQVTKHAPHPVRFLSIANDGTLCYGLNGAIWFGKPGQEPSRLDVRVVTAERTNLARVTVQRGGATAFAVSPSGKEIAFVVRGEIFVASVKHGTTRRVTDTPEQERSPTWASDGRTLYYAGERDGSWNLYKSSLSREVEKHFFLATVLKEEPVLVSVAETFQPVVSPDGKQIAYLHDRDELRVLDLATGESRTLVPKEKNYSYSDGDIDFAWSPDSQWIALTFIGGQRWIADIGVVHVATGKLENITLSGYYEGLPGWSADSKALLLYSNRLGRRSHGSWGSDGDIFALYLTREALDHAKLTPEEYDLLHEGEKKGRKGNGKEEREKEKDKPAEPVVIEFEGRENRFRRLTLHSAPIRSYALSPDGETLVYFARVEEKWDLWKNEVREGKTERLLALGDDRGGDVVFGKDGDAVFVRKGGGGMLRVDLKKGKPEPVKYAAEMSVHGARERRYIFEHAWRQVRQKFYDEKLHGVDWQALRKNYAAFLPGINNRHDFAELLSEMLGELNASHTGARYRAPQEGKDQTAALGLLFDTEHRGAGLKVAEVLERGPVDLAGLKILPGTLLTHLDGVELAADTNHFALLNRKVGKRVLLTFAPMGGGTIEKVVKPIGGRAEYNLRYARWVKQRRALVEERGKGRLGYVHVRGMNDRSFRHVYQEVLGRFGGREALVVDTRFNGGGNLHDDLVKFLGAKQYARFQPRGKRVGQLGGDPGARWARPVIVVQNEGNYSDAHIFPFAFKELGIGKLVGTPVAGTGTAVWWERQIDPTIVFGIPQVGFVTNDGKYLENLELEPDILVYNDPESVAKGQDKQLEAAVDELLTQVGEK